MENKMRVIEKVIATLLCLPFLLIISITPADANLSANTNNTTAMSWKTGIFSVAPETSTNIAVATTGIKSIPAGSGGLDFFFYYLNTGTINISAFTRTITLTAGNATGSTFDSCPIGKTYNNPTQCSDFSAPTTITLTGTGPALSAGQWQPIHIFVNKNTAAYTIASNVTSSQLRAPVNSVS